MFSAEDFEDLGMRVEGDNMVPRGNNTDGEVVLDTTPFEQVHQQQQQKKLVIGYALTSKKKKSFLQPKLEVLARYQVITHFLFSIFLYVPSIV